MKLSQKSITVISDIITGDKKMSPYRSGPELVRLFNGFGSNDTYGSGFPSRWHYTESKITEINGSKVLRALLLDVLHPREFVDSIFICEDVINYVNASLKYDGYEIVIHNDNIKLLSKEETSVECEHPFSGSEMDDHLFLIEQIEKCEYKIQESDYDGAITNARSLLETVLIELDKQFDSEASVYDGDMTKLYKRVQKHLSLDPANPTLNIPLKQVLSGLNSVVTGLSGLSNKMGDRHAQIYKPKKHHAMLVVNSAKTLVTFLFGTHDYQSNK